MNSPTPTQKDVIEYYGRVLKTKHDLKTSVCCPADAVPEFIRPLLKNVHEDVQNRFFGCGSPVPPALEGKTILDLGCGTGRDGYLFSQLVGPEGRVIGVDMTEEQLAVATKYVEYHTALFGYDAPNVEFRRGFIEDLGAVGIEDHSVDVVVSNCVFNLSPRKEDLFREVFRVLKPGGELYFSDVFTGRRVPENLTRDPVLLGECLGGAMYIEDFRRMLSKVGIRDYRIVSKTPLTLDNAEIRKKVGMVDFCSITMRTFQCDFEDICENYGHVAWYRGTIPNFPHAFTLDNHHLFKTGMPVPVCGNTVKMLGETRFSDHFKIAGDFSTHYGAFDCSNPEMDAEGNLTGPCC